MGIFDAIANGLRLAWAYVSGRNAAAERANTPEMQAAARARTEADVADRAASDVAAAQAGNLDQLRKDAAE